MPDVIKPVRVSVCVCVCLNVVEFLVLVLQQAFPHTGGHDTLNVHARLLNDPLIKGSFSHC